MELADHVSTWSRDPSTKVGAVIVSPDTRAVVGMGYNGFPRGVGDQDERYADRPTKYAMVVHAELNAILNANAPVRGCTIYVTPLFTCQECAKAVIQSGIRKVVATKPDSERWGDQFKVAELLLSEAGVEVVFVSADDA